MSAPAIATPADVLDAAAAHIEDVGWSAGPPSGGKACVLIAISRVSWTVITAGAAAQALRAYINRPSIIAWNYAQPDADTVIAALRGAAAAWRANGGAA